jgi:ATP-binding cassette subfamily C (CFTR/MRP) protein 1
MAVSFVTYSLTGHDLDAATIFTALQYFNILETPISFLPMILTALADANSAVRTYA